MVTTKSKQSNNLILERALKALASSNTPEEFAVEVKNLTKVDFETLLSRLPDDLKHNPKIFYKLVKAVGNVNKQGVLVKEFVTLDQNSVEQTQSVADGLRDIVKKNYCTTKDWSHHPESDD